MIRLNVSNGKSKHKEDTGFFKKDLIVILYLKLKHNYKVLL